jgi:hypothetical protein
MTLSLIVFPADADNVLHGCANKQSVQIYHEVTK